MLVSGKRSLVRAGTTRKMDESRLDNIYRMRQAGLSLEEIGSRLGISRQAVEEQLLKHYGSTKVYGLLTLAELARLTGYSRDYIIKLKRRGVIQPVKSGQKNRLYKPETIATIIIYRDRHPRRCRMCGRPLPPRRSVFCSQACRAEGGRFKNRPQAVKDRHRERMKRWERAHPEQAKEIHRRAARKYRAARH